MAKREYLPLKVVLETRNQAITYPEIFLNDFPVDQLPSLEDYTKFIFDADFMNPHYKGPFMKINKYLIKKSYALDDMANHSIYSASDPKTELLDYIGYPMVIQLWEQSKKVYKIDSVFYDELRKTDDFEIPESSLKYLPFYNFYLDLSEAKSAAPIKGAFVHIFESDYYGYQAVIYMITANHCYFSNYSHIRYDENRSFVFSEDKRSPMTPFTIYDAPSGTTKKAGDYDPRNDIAKSIFQIIMFLSSANPDFEENSETKQTYRPSNVIKNKFSEIQMWDVGVRYGRAIRFAKREAEKTNREHTKTSEQRKPVRPHVRCAHWQRFHVGKGRTEVRIKWIPPVFVCGSREIPVTIHEVSL